MKKSEFKNGNPTLALMRHTQAEPRSLSLFPDDSLRPLTRTGRKQAKRIAKGLDRIGFHPKSILTSPFERTRRTAEIVAEVLGLKPKVLMHLDCLAESALPAKSFRILRAHPLRYPVLIVGHEPFLGEWLSLCLTGSSTSSFPFSKGGVALITGHPLSPGEGRLAAFLPPHLVNS